MNQAFYTRLEIANDEQIRPTLAEPFATISEKVQGKERKHEYTASCDVVWFRRTTLVEHRGLEPLTYGLQSRRSTS